MDTLTMVKEAIANPGQEFETTCGRVHYKDGKLKWVHSGHTFAIDCCNLQYRWRKAPEPVEFQIALKAYNDEGKTIICYWNGCHYSYTRTGKGIVDTQERAIIAAEILEGEWYIED